MTTRTAAAHREEAKVVHQAFIETCPTHQIVMILSDKWASLVVAILSGGSLRHGQIRTAIASVSQKMLTQTLRTLERDGLVERTVTADVPVRVDYSLTELGRTLVPIISAMQTWSAENIEQILDSREHYDNRGAAGPGSMALPTRGAPAQ